MARSVTPESPAPFALNSRVKRKGIAADIQLEAAHLVPVVPLGQFFQPSAYRTSLTGFLEVPIPVMWNVEKK